MVVPWTDNSDLDQSIHPVPRVAGPAYASNRTDGYIACLFQAQRWRFALPSLPMAHFSH
jgi:hypothetical protein